LPEGIDRNAREIYLSNEEFSQVLKMDRDAFAKLPKWKQKKFKRSCRFVLGIFLVGLCCFDLFWFVLVCFGLF